MWRPAVHSDARKVRRGGERVAAKAVLGFPEGGARVSGGDLKRRQPFEAPTEAGAEKLSRAHRFPVKPKYQKRVTEEV